MKCESKIRAVLEGVDERGFLQSRESATLEFKESFSFSDMNDYAKTMAAFANNKGGIFIFGVMDSPRRIVGVKREKFEEISTEKINDFVVDAFSPYIDWGTSVWEVSGKFVGAMYVNEAIAKPVICRKNSGKVLKSGAIYYRYRGQTRSIEYAELKMIHDDIRDKERKKWMSHIQKVTRIGIENVEIVDLFRGEINSGDAKFVLDESLLKKMRSSFHFVESGKFVERDGEPTLMLVGEITPTAKVQVKRGDPEKDYPHFTKDLKNSLGINMHQIRMLIWKCKLKGNSRYHLELTTSKKSESKAHKYSDYALERLEKELIVMNDKQAWHNLKLEYDAEKRKVSED